ncbi:MAG: AMP-binding protein, partial [Thermodesulfobacteriota bacterium]|nr:AMP-binding protein [Thermodesulfobacteriota bacterium]
EVKAAFPHVTVIQGYGLTETSPYITVTDPDNAEKKMASIGKPVPGVEVEVVDAKGAVLPVGQVGEIITRGFHVMKEYHGLPHATREKLKDGWFYTGDIGKFDEDGYLYHLGRKDDMIITGGLNVYPAEIENVLSQIPDVWEVAAYGIQDALRGEVIYASVVLNPESPYGKDDLLAYCRENLARFKVPNKIEIKKELPKNNIGKIDKLALVKEAKTQYSST